MRVCVCVCARVRVHCVNVHACVCACVRVGTHTESLLLFVWNTHSFIDSFDNHSTASGPASCRRHRPPGNAVSGHSSTMCLVVWWLSPQGQAGDAITPHR